MCIYVPFNTILLSFFLRKIGLGLILSRWNCFAIHIKGQKNDRRYVSFFFFDRSQLENTFHNSFSA